MDTYCATFTLKGKAPDGKPVEFEGYSELVWIDERTNREGREADYMHFAADSLNMPIGEICQIVSELGGQFNYDCAWLDAYVPMHVVSQITFEHD